MKKHRELSKSSVLYQLYWSLGDPYLTSLDLVPGRTILV